VTAHKANLCQATKNEIIPHSIQQNRALVKSDRPGGWLTPCREKTPAVLAECRAVGYNALLEARQNPGASPIHRI
jgi:hypothetical protein